MPKLSVQLPNSNGCLGFNAFAGEAWRQAAALSESCEAYVRELGPIEAIPLFEKNTPVIVPKGHSFVSAIHEARRRCAN